MRPMHRPAARLLVLVSSLCVGALGVLTACTGDDPATAPPADEADATVPTDAAVDVLDAADASAAFYIFVSEGMWNGQEVGGVTGADGKCQAEAEAAGLSGRHVAWLNGDQASFMGRIESDGGPWRRRDDAVIFNDYGKLPTAPRVPLLYTAKGQGVPHGTHFWTGQAFPDASKNPDVFESLDCASWTSGDAGLLGVYGDPEGTRFDWTYLGRDTCDQPRHLVCIRGEPHLRQK
ncbi:MAG: Tryptophan synthase alpha chain [Labilithrix sp.]|nr:Tryptophan synthase alpha chain [Labilithrix sp.]